MKKILCIALTMGLWANVYAGTDRRVATQQEAERFFKDTTYVVLTNDNIILDALLRKTVDKSWTVTPYKFIDNGEFKKLRTKNKNSFLLITKVAEGKDKQKRNYLCLSLLVGDAKAGANLDVMPELGFIPLSCENQANELNAFLLEPLVLFVQKNAEKLKNAEFDKKLLLSVNSRLSAYNYNTAALKSKTIYMERNQIGEKVKKDKLADQFGSKLVVEENLEALARALAQDKDSAAVAISIYPEKQGSDAYAHKMVLDMSGNLYYYYQEKKEKNFNFHDGDFDRLMRVYK